MDSVMDSAMDSAMDKPISKPEDKPISKPDDKPVKEIIHVKPGSKGNHHGIIAIKGMLGLSG